MKLVKNGIFEHVYDIFNEELYNYVRIELIFKLTGAINQHTSRQISRDVYNQLSANLYANN